MGLQVECIESADVFNIRTLFLYKGQKREYFCYWKILPPSLGFQPASPLKGEAELSSDEGEIKYNALFQL